MFKQSPLCSIQHRENGQVKPRDTERVSYGICLLRTRSVRHGYRGGPEQYFDGSAANEKQGGNTKFRIPGAVTGLTLRATVLYSIRTRSNLQKLEAEHWRPSCAGSNLSVEYATVKRKQDTILMIAGVFVVQSIQIGS